MAIGQYAIVLGSFDAVVINNTFVDNFFFFENDIAVSCDPRDLAIAASCLTFFSSIIGP